MVVLVDGSEGMPWKFDILIDGVDKASIVDHCKFLIWSQEDLLDLLLQSTLSVAVLRKRGDGRAIKILGVP